MRDNKRIYSIGRIILFLVGLSILLYPTVSNRWNEYRSRQLVSRYSENIQSDDTDSIDEQRTAAQEYNSTLYEPTVPDAFSIRDGIRDEEYERLLNPANNGIMGYIEIPVINVSIPVYHYTTEESMEKGAGHLLGSSLPVGGKGTHAIISAHRGLPSAKMFTDLNLVRKKDLFYLHILGDTLAYEVDSIKIVEPHDTKDLGIDRDEDYVTLITCTPYAVNTHRLLVRGHRVPYSQETYEDAHSKPGRMDKVRILWQLVSAAGGIAVALILVFIISRHTRKKERNNKTIHQKEKKNE